LLEGGADVQRGNSDGYNALHEAANNGHLDVCRLLLDKGAEMNRIGGGYKETALHRAARHGRMSVLQLLVGRGANVTLRDKHGETAADTARKWRQTDVAGWLDTVSRVK
jgi:ankyrin repeat protein